MGDERSTHRRRDIGARLASGLLATALVLGACADESPKDDAERDAATTVATTTSTTTTTLPIATRRPFAAIQLNRTYERPGPDGAPRSLLTEVWVPDGDGPFPLVAFAHGNDGHPRKFHELFGAWAAAGYAVVAPRFPVSADDANRNLADSVADVDNQVADLVYVTGQAISESDSGTGDLAAKIDGDIIAVAGLSLGGGTALLTGYADPTKSCCPGLPAKVVLAFSPVPFATTAGADAAPLLLMHGTKDLALPYGGSKDLFGSLQMRRWFVTMPDAAHAAPYEDDPSPQDELVRQVSIDFLDQFLLGDDTGVSRAESTIAASGIASIESAG